MNRMLLLCATAVLSFGGLAQNVPQLDSADTKVFIAKLSAPGYPPLARQARITGTAKLDVTVRANGSVESVAPVSGHPILIKSALDSAQRTQFECRGCSEPTRHLMTYIFQLGEAIYCTGIDA